MSEQMFAKYLTWEKVSDYAITTAINALEREIEREAKEGGRLEKL